MNCFTYVFFFFGYTLWSVSSASGSSFSCQIDSKSDRKGVWYPVCANGVDDVSTSFNNMFGETIQASDAKLVNKSTSTYTCDHEGKSKSYCCRTVVDKNEKAYTCMIVKSKPRT